MKTLLIVLIVCAGIANNLAAQDTIPSTASDTLVVLWSSGDPEVAEKACLMYTGYAKRLGWFREVILLAWGPSERLMSENEMVKEKIAALQEEGVIVQACIVCANMYGVTDDLKVCSVDVRGTGGLLTKYIRRGYKMISF
ncbi:MAG: DsrE family protein [Bacteroidales bacterium]|nr:DsrE family protein [Bacteroidales bacterium]